VPLARSIKLDRLIRDASFREYVITEIFRTLDLSDEDFRVNVFVAMAIFPEALSPCETLIPHSSISDQLKLIRHLRQSLVREDTDSSSIIKPCPLVVGKNAGPNNSMIKKSGRQNPVFIVIPIIEPSWAICPG